MVGPALVSVVGVVDGQDTVKSCGKSFTKGRARRLFHLPDLPSHWVASQHSLLQVVNLPNFLLTTRLRHEPEMSKEIQ